MKGTIPSDFIKELLSRTDIINIISRFVNLKKTGKNFMACCPFHQEKTPSFSVNYNKQLYYCFGCHATGDVISFLSAHENLSFVEAVEELAILQGTTIPFKYLQTKESSIKISLIYKVLNDANKLFQWNLKQNSASNGEVIKYIKKRGLNKLIIDEYQIGFSPNHWDYLLSNLKIKYSKKILEQAGLIIKYNDKHLYDRFRNRLIFPIYNRRGQVIGFGGRCLNVDNNQLKYLNSPETLVFHKNEQLYGLYELKKRQNTQEIMVVEGYMDVIVLAAYGYPFAVATLGTALSQTHAKILFRETNQIILCFDGDQAGRTASIRAFKILLPMLNISCQAKFLILPEGEDPDSYIRKVGKESFLKVTKSALGPAEFLLRYIQKENKNSDSADELAKLFERAREVLHDIPENVYTLSIITHLSKQLQVSKVQLHKILYSKTAYNTKKFNNIVKRRKKWNLNLDTLSLTEKALSYALSMPEVFFKILSKKIDIHFQCFTEQDFILLDALVIIRQNSSLSSALLLRILSKKYSQFKLYFYQLVQKPIELEDSLIIDECIAILNKIVVQAYHHELNRLIKKSKSTILNSTEKNRLRILLYNTVNK